MAGDGGNWRVQSDSTTAKFDKLQVGLLLLATGKVGDGSIASNKEKPAGKSVTLTGLVVAVKSLSGELGNLWFASVMEDE